MIFRLVLASLGYKLVTMRYSVVILSLVFVCALGLVPVRAQRAVERNQWKQLISRPSDTLEAERLRVWIPQERQNTCRVSVLIYDTEGLLVRQLVNMLVSPGYHNIYWDKKDDSGRLVEAGTYHYKTNPCGGNRRGDLIVHYLRGELTSSLSIDRFMAERMIDFSIEEDSAEVTLEILDRKDNIVHILIDHQPTAPGTYEQVFEPTRAQKRAVYKVRLTVDEYVHVKQGKLRR